MSSSNNDEEYKWPESGNAGPDVEWEGDVPIEIPEIPGPAETPTLPPISPGTEDQGKDAGDQTKEDQKDAVDGDEDETKEVSTLERYYPSPQEVKETFPENLDELFEKYGDDLIIEDDENGKPSHIYFHSGEKRGKKHYRCITKGCNSYLLVKKIPKPGCPSHSPLPNQQKVRTPKNTPKGKGKKKEKADEDPQEGCSKEDQKENEENVKDESKGAIPKKRKPKKKKSNKKGKNKKKMYK